MYNVWAKFCNFFLLGRACMFSDNVLGSWFNRSGFGNICDSNTTNRLVDAKIVLLVCPVILFLALIACRDLNHEEKYQIAPVPPVPSTLDIDTSDGILARTSTQNSMLFPFHVVDSLGREIVFAESPERIVAFDAAAVEILFAIGEGRRVVATHSFVTSPPDVLNIPKVGDAFNMNLEAIVALEPDLVFVFFERFVKDLEDAGLIVLYVESISHNFEQTTENIMMWGRITDNLESAEERVVRFNSELDAIIEGMKDVKTFTRILQDVGGLWAPGSDTLIGEVFELLKLENIASDLSGYEQISPEAVVAGDPQVIITVSPDTFTKNEAFKNLSAVKNQKVFSLSSDSLSTAGPRFVEGIKELGRLIYPEIFETDLQRN